MPPNPPPPDGPPAPAPGASGRKKRRAAARAIELSVGTDVHVTVQRDAPAGEQRQWTIAHRSPAIAKVLPTARLMLLKSKTAMPLKTTPVMNSRAVDNDCWRERPTVCAERVGRAAAQRSKRRKRIRIKRGLRIGTDVSHAGKEQSKTNARRDITQSKTMPHFPLPPGGTNPYEPGMITADHAAGKAIPRTRSPSATGVAGGFGWWSERRSADNRRRFPGVDGGPEAGCRRSSRSK